VREFLDGRGEAELAAVVVANMRQAEYEPESWLSELQTMQEEGVLETFLAGVKSAAAATAEAAAAPSSNGSADGCGGGGKGDPLRLSLQPEREQAPKLERCETNIPFCLLPLLPLPFCLATASEPTTPGQLPLSPCCGPGGRAACPACRWSPSRRRVGSRGSSPG